MKYFISDLHFGHEKMREIRGFLSIEEHDNYLIENYNSVIKNKTDKVYLLGDICWNIKSLENINKLKGQKYIILGNHDMYPNHYLSYFNKYFGASSIKLGNMDCIMTHIPVHPGQLEHRFNLNIHGHLHTQNINYNGHLDSRYINVSCDNQFVNYKPVSEDSVIDNFYGLL